MTVRRQDTPSATLPGARQDGFRFDVHDIMRESGLEERSVRAWRSGLVVIPELDRRCQDACARLAGRGLQDRAQTEAKAFNEKLDAGFKRGAK